MILWLPPKTSYLYHRTWNDRSSVLIISWVRCVLCFSWSVYLWDRRVVWSRTNFINVHEATLLPLSWNTGDTGLLLAYETVFILHRWFTYLCEIAWHMVSQTKTVLWETEGCGWAYFVRGAVLYYVEYRPLCSHCLWGGYIRGKVREMTNWVHSKPTIVAHKFLSFKSNLLHCLSTS